VAEKEHQHHKQWEEGLLRHEKELANMMKSLLEYSEETHVRDSLGRVQAGRLAAACCPSASDAIGAVIVADGTHNAAER